ncbi:MAG TPA: hypothetical protein VIH99_11210 [Bdellovibrionota bacterium]|jgi:hypothetical protein
MVPKLLFFLVPAVLLVASVLSIAFWERRSKPVRAQSGDGEPEGAFRAFYHVLWVLMLWSGLCLSLPFWVSYKEKIVSTLAGDRWPLMARVLALPVVLLMLLWYGGRRGYLKWIDSLGWPDGENR